MDDRSVIAKIAAGVALAALVAVLVGTGASRAEAAPLPGLCGLTSMLDPLFCDDRSRASDAAANRSTTPTTRFDPNRIVVTFRKTTTRETALGVLRRAGVAPERPLWQLRAYLGRVEPERRDDALAFLRRADAVDSAGQEVILEGLETTPNDEAWSDQWGLHVAGFPRAWDFTRGSAKIVVAVIDTGVELDHPELRGSFVPGYDLINQDSDASDDHGHGTAVAGVLAARANNGQGVAGVCWACRIMPVKVLNDNGLGSSALIAAGVVWATDHGAQVINLSLGGPGTTSALADAVAYATRKGAIVVAAAGNSGTSTSFYPAAEPTAIAVAATDRSDRLYSWSNYGAWIGFAAPGCNLAPLRGGRYAEFCGTSSATPVVAGLAALALSANPDVPREELERAIRNTAVSVGGDIRYGRVDASRTITTIGLAPPRALIRFRGVVSRRAPIRRFRRLVGEGRLNATLTFTRGRVLRLALVNVLGKRVAVVKGRSPLRLSRHVSSGTHTLVVKGGKRRTSFRLALSYPRNWARLR
jgi:subtilisin family serine protease